MRPSRFDSFIVCLVLSVIAFSVAMTQQPILKDSAPPALKLRVFLDCNFCDFDFMRTEISFVDYVRDRQDAQIHILVTDQATGGGGVLVTAHFLSAQLRAHHLCPLP